MKDIQDIEVIQINTINGNLYATISYQDIRNIDNVNSGYDTIQIPFNIREMKLSSRGNLLVDQSIKKDSIYGNESYKN